MALVRALLLPLLAAVSLHCAAAPFAVRLGGERMVLDAPPGFADTLDLASPRLRELAESLTSASNRFLGAIPVGPVFYSPLQDGWVSPQRIDNTDMRDWSPKPPGSAYARAGTYGLQIRAVRAAN
jgi:hypothetical protein